MKVRSGVLAIILSTFLGAAWLPAATAQAPGSQPLQSSPPAYGDEELKSFAAAAIEVQRINDFYLPKLQAAQSAQEEQDVQRTASGEMMQAVESKGITVDKFNEILVIAQLDPEIADRIAHHIQAQQ